MLFLAHLLGKPVLDRDGERVGSVADLLVSADRLFPQVTGVLLSRRGQSATVAPWSQVSEANRDNLRLIVPASELRTREIAPNELLLARDLLDKQIVDTHGVRIVRVNDLKLAQTDHQLRLVGADIGLRGLLRRLNLETGVNTLAGMLHLRLPQHLIGWNYVQPLEGEWGAVRLKVPQSRIARLRAPDLAEIIGDLDPPAQARLLEMLDDQRLAEVISEMEPEDQLVTLSRLAVERVPDILTILPPDEAADILGDLPTEAADRLLGLMDPERARNLRELLRYPDYTAGGRMTTHFVALPAELSVEQALSRLRELGRQAEFMDYLYVVNANGELQGTISLRELISARPSSSLEEAMGPEPASVGVYQDQEEVARLLSRYHLRAVPVIGTDSRLAGVVTADDVLEVMEEEASQDFSLVTGASREVEPTTSVVRESLWRMPWLMAALAVVLGLVFLVWSQLPGPPVGWLALAFIPLLISLAAQLGSQSSAMVLRSIALGEVRAGAWLAYLGRELVAALAWGALGGAASAGMVWIWGAPQLALPVGLAMLITLPLATVVGSALPVALWRVRVDPALALRPMMTALAVALGLPALLLLLRVLG